VKSARGHQYCRYKGEERERTRRRLECSCDRSTTGDLIPSGDAEVSDSNAQVLRLDLQTKAESAQGREWEERQTYEDTIDNVCHRSTVRRVVGDGDVRGGVWGKDRQCEQARARTEERQRTRRVEGSVVRESSSVRNIIDRRLKCSLPTKRDRQWPIPDRTLLPRVENDGLSDADSARIEDGGEEIVRVEIGELAPPFLRRERVDFGCVSSFLSDPGVGHDDSEGRRMLALW
jgi:hypothetical protein